MAPSAPFIPSDKQEIPVIGIMVYYTGDINEGKRVVAPLRQLSTRSLLLTLPLLKQKQRVFLERIQPQELGEDF